MSMESLYEYGSRAGRGGCSASSRAAPAPHRLRRRPRPAGQPRRSPRAMRRRRSRDRRPRPAVDQLPGRRPRHRAGRTSPRRCASSPSSPARRRSGGTPAATRRHATPRGRARRLPLRLRLLRRRPALLGRRSTGTPHLVVPYTLDTNDMRFATAAGLQLRRPVLHLLPRRLRRALRGGCDDARRCCRSGCTPGIIGRPARFAALQRLARPRPRRPDVWVCRRVDIARHWIVDLPARAEAGTTP